MLPQVAWARRVPLRATPHGAQEHVGERGKPQPQLVGAQGSRAGAVGEQVELLFLDAVLHIPAGAVDLFIQGLGRGVVLGQVGDDEARVATFLEVLGLGDDTA